MRILAITNMFPSAAFPTQGVFVQQQINGLQAIGLDVRVLFVDRRQAGPTAYYRLRTKVRSAVNEFEPDTLHVMYGGVMADQIARHHHLRPVVVTFHGSDLLGENLSGWARKIISRYGVRCSQRAASAADGVVLVARHLARALNGAAAGDKVRVIPCGIDLERFRPLDPPGCRQRLGWNSRSFHVLFASGNGDPVKRPWLAEAAVAQMCNAGQPVEMHRLTAVPNEEVPVWLNASDVLLLTSLHEGSPTVVKEALACNLPVVSVDVGDVGERIEGMEGCYLAPPEPAELAEKLCLVRQRGRRLNCRMRVKELSILNTAHKLKQFYEAITRRLGTTGLAGWGTPSYPLAVFPANRETVVARKVTKPKRRAEPIFGVARPGPGSGT
ncbi:MAG TPA: glycosyltransferase [Candidatus Binatia bacterium]|jgi:teichuronic acid biosynthesis glycosyltransferase TuaC|nr:glycosyltransferase [Candidatus Binatia bacterium]